MKVTLLTYTPNPEKTIACAAKLCYANVGIDDLYDGLTEEKTKGFIEKLASLGHESPMEHASFTFGIEGISRSCSHQLVRHRIASYSQQSQRYVDMEYFEPIIPEDIKKNENAMRVFDEYIKQAKTAYDKLSVILKEQYIKDGVISSVAQKRAIENARAVLPNACETKIVVTMNARSLMNFFEHRCCNRAQAEIKAVADEMLRLVCQVAPTLFSSAGPDCYKKGCPEGKMTCGKAKEMKAFYTQIHNG